MKIRKKFKIKISQEKQSFRSDLLLYKLRKSVKMLFIFIKKKLKKFSKKIKTSDNPAQIYMLQTQHILHF